MKGRKISLAVLSAVCAGCLAVGAACGSDDDPSGANRKPSGDDDFQKEGNLVTADYTIDGVLDEEVWSDPNVFTVKYGLDSHVTAKIVWGEKGLTVGFDVKDTTLAASKNYSNPEYVIHSDNVEFYIDTLDDGGKSCQTDDYEFIFNPEGRAMLQVGGGTAWGSWSGVIDYEAKANGTINDDSDTDVGWVLEMFLPYTTFGFTKDSTIGISFGSRLKTTNLLYSDWYGWVNDPQIPDSYVSINKDGVVGTTGVEGLNIKSGYWEKTENGYRSGGEQNNLAALDGKTLSEGTFKATLSGFGGSDNGIVFGMNTEPALFWESGGAHYYFLFINKDGLLILSQIDDRYIDLKTAIAIPGFDAKKSYEVGVAVKDGVAYCLLDGEILLQREVDLTYAGIGLRAQAANVAYKKIEVSADVPEINDGIDGLRFAQGEFTEGASAGEYVSTGGNAIGVLTEKTFAKGTFKGTVTAGAASGDNGLLFGIPQDAPKTFWESETEYYFVFIAANRGAIQLAKVKGGWQTLKEQNVAGFDAAAPYEIKIVWNEGRIAVYANGTLYIDYTDESPLTGTQVGIRTQAANITFGGFNVTADTTMPEKPKTESENYTFASGEFKEESGSLASTKGGSLAVHKTLTLARGTFTADMNAGVAGDNGIVFGIPQNAPATFWESADAPYYFFFINLHGDAYLTKAGSSWQECKVVHIADYNAANTYTLKVSVNEGEILCFVNGNLLINYTDASPLTGTKVGVRTQNADVSFSNVAVTDTPVVIEKTKFKVTNGAATEENGAVTATTNDMLAMYKDVKLAAGTISADMKTGVNADSGIVFRVDYNNEESFWVNASQYYFFCIGQAGQAALARDGAGWNWISEKSIANYNAENTYRLQVVIEAQRIRGYVDGVLYVDYHTDALFAGTGVGVRTNRAGTVFSNFTVSDQIPAESISDFKMTTGSATVADGTLTTVGNGTNDSFGIYLGKTVSASKGYTVSTKIKYAVSADNGIVFGVTYAGQNDFWTEGSQYFLTISGNGFVGLGKEGGGLGWSWPVNPHENRQTNQTEACVAGQEYTLSVTVEGAKITAYLDGVMIFEYTDESPLEGTYVGIRGKGGNEYSGFTVTPKEEN